MLHKIVETGKTDNRGLISLNIVVMHVTKIIVFFLRQTKHADYYHRYYNHRDRHVGYPILDRNCYD